MSLTALTVLWEATDRNCGKHLKKAIPTFITAMERRGTPRSCTRSSQSTVLDERPNSIWLLVLCRDFARQRRRRTGVKPEAYKSIAVRTFEDWNDPPPGYFEMDTVAHCGRSVAETTSTASFDRSCFGSTGGDRHIPSGQLRTAAPSVVESSGELTSYVDWYWDQCRNRISHSSHHGIKSRRAVEMSVRGKPGKPTSEFSTLPTALGNRPGFPNPHSTAPTG